MPRFWSFISNKEYSVGCTGQSVHVYDMNGTELAVFKGLLYAYLSVISPRGDIFVVKTTEGRLFVYSLKTLSLIKKFRFSKANYSQDNNCCFSPDGRYFYSIERGPGNLSSLSVYDTNGFSLEKRLFTDNEKRILNIIEYNAESASYYIMGFYHPDEADSEGCNSYFISQFKNDTLINTVYITESEYEYYHSYKQMEAMGFTEISKKWALGLKWYGYDLKGIEKRNHSLAKLWEYYMSDKKP